MRGILFTGLVLFQTVLSVAQTQVAIDEVKVSATRSSEEFSKVARSVIVISKEEIEAEDDHEFIDSYEEPTQNITPVTPQVSEADLSAQIEKLLGPMVERIVQEKVQSWSQSSMQFQSPRMYCKESYT